MVPETDARVTLDRERVDYWVGVGAKPSHKVGVLIRKYGTDGTHLEQQQQAIERLAAHKQRSVVIPPVVIQPKPEEEAPAEEPAAEAPAEAPAETIEEPAAETPAEAPAETTEEPAAEAAPDEAPAEEDQAPKEEQS